MMIYYFSFCNFQNGESVMEEVATGGRSEENVSFSFYFLLIIYTMFHYSYVFVHLTVTKMVTLR